MADNAQVVEESRLDSGVILGAGEAPAAVVTVVVGCRDSDGSVKQLEDIIKGLGAVMARQRN